MGNSKSRKVLLAGASALGLSAGLMHSAAAVSTTIVAHTTTAFTLNNGDSLEVTDTGMISGVPTGVVIASSGGGTLTNSGAIIGAGRAAGMTSGRSLDLIDNRAVMTGTSAYGIANDGSIGTVLNSGTLSGGIGGLASDGVIGTVNNSGTVTAQNAIYNLLSGPSLPGSIGTIYNSGLLTGTNYGVNNTGSIGALFNEAGGTIRGVNGAINNIGAGTIGALTNSGVIEGNINSLTALMISGGTGTTVGTLTGYAAGSQGTITAPVNFVSGNIYLNDNVTGSVTNAANLTLGSALTITGNYSQSAGVLDLTASGLLTVTGTASLTGGTVVVGSILGGGNYIVGSGSATLIDASPGSTYAGVTVVFSGLTGLSGHADTSSTEDLQVVYQNDYIGGNVSDLNNTGSIGGASYGAYVASGGNIGTFNNTGTIGGTTDAFYNGGTITLLNNDGVISDGDGIDNAGTIFTLTNTGLIEGDSGINNTGSIGTVINSGTITGPNYAIYNIGSLGSITNSGLISGNISSSSALTIAGGTGNAVGTLSGGVITADVNFTSGNLLLSDNITGNAGLAGASLKLASTISITGNYNQTSGDLQLDANKLVVSGKATITGGTVSAPLSSSGNYLVGSDLVLIAASAGSSYAGATINFTGPAALSASTNTASTDDLTVQFRNDYIGGSLAGLTNSGAISGTAYGVYVNSTGVLGSLANSGTIGGNLFAVYNAGSLGTIVNTGLISGNIYSTTALVIAGGSKAGTLSGGTITASAVTFTSGNVLLGDNIVAGTVTNSGAALELNSTRTITGNYSQTGGSLVIDVASAASYGSLVVSGGAAMSNAVVTLSGSGLSYGQAYTIVDANSASNYTGVTVHAGTMFSMVSVVNNDLIVRLGLPLADIGNAVGGDAAITGGVLNGLQGNSSFGSLITALAGASTAEQGNALKQAAPAQVGNGVLLLQRAGLMSGMIDAAIRASLLRKDRRDGAFWMDVMGGAAERDAAGAAERTDISAWGVAMGADTLVRDGLVLGGAVSWGSGWNSGTGVLAENSNRVGGVQLTAYGSWSDGALTVNALAGLGLNDYVQQRRIDVTSQTAEARYSGRTYEILADAGYDIPLGDFTLTPMASLKWLRVAAAGYSESGAGVLNMTVGDTTADQVQSRIGARLEKAFDTSLGMLAPDFSIAWVHDYVGDAVTTDAVLSGVAFSTTALRPGSDGVALEAGLSLFTAGGTSVHVSYDGEFRGGYASHAGVVKFAISF